MKGLSRANAFQSSVWAYHKKELLSFPLLHVPYLLLFVLPLDCIFALGIFADLKRAVTAKKQSANLMRGSSRTRAVNKRSKLSCLEPRKDGI